MAGSRSGELRPVGISENWGEGAVVSHPESPVAVYYRFYEWNLFGAVRPGLHTQADKNQRVEATWEAESGLIEYPEQGVALTLEPADRGVDLALTVENHSDRDWPALAALVSCLNPGRQGGDPKQSALADREIHWHEDYHDRVRRRRPDGGRSVVNGDRLGGRARRPGAQPLVVSAPRRRGWPPRGRRAPHARGETLPARGGRRTGPRGLRAGVPLTGPTRG